MLKFFNEVLKFKICNASCQTNYVNTYQTDLRQIMRVDRNQAVIIRDRCEISFSIIRGTSSWQPIFGG